MDMVKARRLIRDTAPYQLIAGQLYKQGKDGVMRRCVREDEFILILDEAHSRIAGGHFAAETTAQKVLQAGLWWPTLFMMQWNSSKDVILAKEYQSHKIGTECPCL